MQVGKGSDHKHGRGPQGCPLENRQTLWTGESKGTLRKGDCLDLSGGPKSQEGGDLEQLTSSGILNNKMPTAIKLDSGDLGTKVTNGHTGNQSFLPGCWSIDSIASAPTGKSCAGRTHHNKQRLVLLDVLEKHLLLLGIRQVDPAP